MTIQANPKTLRPVAQIVSTKPFAHGSGFHAFSIGQQELGTAFYPFIQLDHYFMSQPTFGPHPHRGISAVTYMFEDSAGTFLNRDSQGDRSFIRPGDLHWTQAGLGITHEETPTEPGKVCHGIQLFVDLPSADKSLPGRAFHLAAADIPVYETAAGSRVRVVVGSANGVTSPLNITTQMRFLDVTVPAHQTISHDLAHNEFAFLLTIRGSGSAGNHPQLFHPQDAVLFEHQGSELSIQAGPEGLQYILCIGQAPA